MFSFLWVVSKEGVLVKTPIIQLLDTCLKLVEPRTSTGTCAKTVIPFKDIPK